MIALLLGLALATEASCQGVELPEATGPRSVAWVSPVARSVGRNREVMVVPTSELRGWIARESNGTVARMLQRLGVRGKSREPKKRWKVVIFDAEPGDLCRPVAGHDDPVAVAGLVSCKPGPSTPSRGQSGCGYTVDRATGEMGIEQFRGAWADLARNGFCVLPADRFIEAARTP